MVQVTTAIAIMALNSKVGTPWVTPSLGTSSKPTKLDITSQETKGAWLVEQPKDGRVFLEIKGFLKCVQN